MKIGLVADSHGNVDYLVLAAERLIGQHQVDRIFHLGGGARDVEEVIAFKKKMLRGTEEYGDDAFLADVADFLAASNDAAGKGGDEISEFRKRWTVVNDPSDAASGGSGSQAEEAPQPEKIMDMIGSHITLALYDPTKVDAEDLQNSVLILHGKLGRHGVVEKKKRFFICPGHLRDKEHEGQPASFAVLEVIPKMARVCAYSMQGELLQEYPLNLEKKGKMTVK